MKNLLPPTITPLLQDISVKIMPISPSIHNIHKDSRSLFYFPYDTFQFALQNSRDK